MCQLCRFLAQFRSEQVTAIEVTPQSQTEIMRTLNALGNLGTVYFDSQQFDRAIPPNLEATEIERRLVEAMVRMYGELAPRLPEGCRAV